MILPKVRREQWFFGGAHRVRFHGRMLYAITGPASTPQSITLAPLGATGHHSVRFRRRMRVLRVSDMCAQQEQTKRYVGMVQMAAWPNELAVRIAVEKARARVTLVLAPEQLRAESIDAVAGRNRVSGSKCQHGRQMSCHGQLTGRLNSRIESRFLQRLQIDFPEKPREPIDQISPRGFDVRFDCQFRDSPLTPAFVVITLAPRTQPHSFKDDVS
jgi:hypothetical protein